jgi:type VI secretion system protein ImpC
MVADYEFDNGPEDIKLLKNIAAVAAVAQCPFIAAAGPGFFGLSSFDEFAQIPNLATILDTSDYLDWRSFRGSKDSLYAGLTLPKFLLRLPYGEDANRVEGFNYTENFGTEHHDEYLWGKASFALASNIARSFSNFGWPVNFLGAQSVGLIENLPIHVHEAGVDTMEYRIPLEIKIPDLRETDFADNGFIPLLVHEDRNIGACFVSANSAHQVETNDDEGISARNRFTAELSCMLLLTRVVHYLRVIQRDELGRGLSAEQVQTELNRWINQYTCGLHPRSERLKADRPLATARVDVQESVDISGYFDVQIFMVPHHQEDGRNLELSLTARMPEAR